MRGDTLVFLALTQHIHTNLVSSSSRLSAFTKPSLILPKLYILLQKFARRWTQGLLYFLSFSSVSSYLNFSFVPFLALNTFLSPSLSGNLSYEQMRESERVVEDRRMQILNI